MSQYILIYFPNTLSEVSRNRICTSNNSAGITKSASAWLWPPCRCLQGYSPFPQHLTSLWLYFYSTSVSCQLQTTGLLCNQHDFQSHLTTHTHFPPNTSELRTWHRVREWDLHMRVFNWNKKYYNLISGWVVSSPKSIASVIEISCPLLCSWHLARASQRVEM